MQKQHGVSRARGGNARPLQLTFIHLQPLSVPKVYDDSFKVDVQLDQPLWSIESPRGSFAADIMSHCIQLDAVIATLLIGSASTSPGKKSVTFQQGFTSTVITVLDKMADTLSRKGISMTIEEYLYYSGLDRVFPRVSQYLDNPADTITAPPSDDGYFSRVTALNNLLVLSQQILTNVQTSVSHKYIAHQLALLYQSLGTFGEPLLKHKKTIESRFAVLRDICSAETTSNAPPRLTSELQKWLTDLLSELVSVSTSFGEEFVSQLHPLTDLVVNKLDSPLNS